MKKIKAFLRRKDIIFSAKRYFIDAMGAMAFGLFASLLIGTTVVCYVAFALLYTLAYKLTSNAYYHIVSGAVERE